MKVVFFYFFLNYHVMSTKYPPSKFFHSKVKFFWPYSLSGSNLLPLKSIHKIVFYQKE
jgi:hypothetical protein